MLLAWFVSFFLILLIFPAFVSWRKVALICLLWLFLLWGCVSSGWLIILIDIPCLAVMIILNVVPLRRWFLSRHFFVLGQRMRPHLSSTERDALRVGQVGFEGDIFSGKPDWKKVTTPSQKLSDAEKMFIQGPLNVLCGMINDWDINHCRLDIPEEIWAYLKKEKFFGLILPEKHGGKNFSALAHSEIVHTIASVSVAVATVVSVPNSLGPGQLIDRYGTDDQKKEVLPKLASGEEIPCFALTSEVAGSDAAAIEDCGVVCRAVIAGEEQLAIRLSWKKRYITLAPVATLIGLAVKLYDPTHLLGEQEYLGITCILVAANSPGVMIGRRHNPLHAAFPNGPIRGVEVVVPLSNVIGGTHMIGQGWRMLMECLAEGRSISLPAMTCGGAKRAVYATGAYAQIRRQFGYSIVEFGGVASILARMVGATFLAEAARLFIVSMIDQGVVSAVGSAIVKYHTTELNRRIINDAMDIHGGKGICMGPRNYLAQNYIETPISITVEGANILTRSLIIFGQGAIRSHPYLLKEIFLLEQGLSKKTLREFDVIFFKHVGYIIRNIVRTFGLGLKARFQRKRSSRNNSIQLYLKKFSHWATIFVSVADISIAVMGKKLKREETLSARLGDILSFLYLAAAILRYHTMTAGPEAFPIFQWNCEELLYRMQTQLEQFLWNFPNRKVAFFLRCCIFPLGRYQHPPSDQSEKILAQLISTPGAIRELLGKTIYTKNTPFNPIRQMEEILKHAMEVSTLEDTYTQIIRTEKIRASLYPDRLRQGVERGFLTREQGDLLLSMYKQRQEIIKVDEFDG